jgi:two-component system, OmpR family, sensor histidine kinase TctE
LTRHRLGALSLRAQLLLGILLPVALLVVFNSASLYRQALQAADTAYDRTLLASAKSIGELLEVELAADGLTPKLRGNVLYSALEPFEADNRSRMFYKVSGFAGELVSGFEELRSWHGPLPQDSVYAALVHFYDDRYRDEPVRVAVLLQPVAGQAGLGMATIQVAETLELRRALARQLLLDTLWREVALLAVIAAVVVWVVQRATRPVRALSQALQSRADDDLSPVQSPGASRELQPMIAATNTLMARLAHLLEHQKRFVRDASHQLRTPLAVLKTQVQSARRGDVPPDVALAEIAVTVERATTLANQMLALAKVEQLRQQHDAPVIEGAAVVRAVALELSALIAERQLDFEIVSEPVQLRSHEWALRELTRNLLHNAIKFSPTQARLTVQVGPRGGHAVLGVCDEGPGISAEQRQRLFEPFASHAATTPGQQGSGLGLAICRDIVLAMGGSIRLVNRPDRGEQAGLEAIVELPMAAAAPSPT